MRPFVLASGLAVCAAALAQAPTEFAAMDTNGDGRISAREHAAPAERMFRRMDADAIRWMDADGDGVVTAAEHAAAARAMFLTMDRNKDGSLSPAEFDSGHAALKKKK